MEYPIPNPSGNKMLSLVNELYQRSTGMCRAGAGPYGIGVSVVEDTPIDVFFTFDPDPVLDCKILPEEIPEYTGAENANIFRGRRWGSFSLPRTRRPEYWRKCSGTLKERPGS